MRKDGQTLTVNLVPTASYDTNGTIMGFLGVATDVTARAQAERARQQAEDRLGTLARRLGLATQALQAGIWDWDIRTGLIAWDEKMYEVYGIPKDIQINYRIWADAVVPRIWRKPKPPCKALSPQNPRVLPNTASGYRMVRFDTFRLPMGQSWTIPAKW